LTYHKKFPTKHVVQFVVRGLLENRMPGSTSLPVAIFSRFNSLKARLAFAAVFSAAYLLGAAWFAGSMLNETATTMSISSQQQEDVKLLVKEITKDVWTTEHTLQSFMLSPSQSQRDIVLGTIQSIQNKLPKITVPTWMKQSTQVRNAVRALEINISRLRVRLLHLMEIRVDVTQRFPVARQFVEVMLPANQAFSAAAALAEDEADELHRADHGHFLVYKAFFDTRLAWTKMIGAFRIYVTSRFGIFVSDPLKDTSTQDVNLLLYMNQVIALMNKLDKYEQKGLLGFQESESLAVMHAESKIWIESYRVTKTVFESKNWRADTPLLKKTIQPLFVKIWDDLSVLEHFIDRSAIAGIDNLSVKVDKLSSYYWIFTLLGLILVCAGYFYFELLMRKPILQVTGVLKEKINDNTREAMNLHSGLSEMHELVDVFDQMQNRLISEQKYLDSIVNNAAESIITVNNMGIIQGYNYAAEELFGYKSEEVLGENISLLMPQATRHNHDRFMDESRVRGFLHVSNEKRELVAQHKEGHSVPVSLKLSETVIDGERYFIGLLSDISEQKAMLEALHSLAKYDEVTGLYNRNYFRISLTSAMDLSKASGVFDYTLLYIDLDNFKFVNDTFGYNAGDLLLKEVAGLLSSGTRTSDEIARFGGDVFTILLEKTNDDLALKIANIIHNKISEYVFSFEGKSISINCSIGVSVLNGNVKTTNDFLSQADSACHRAKINGKNRIYLFDKKSQDDRAIMSLDLGWSQKIKAAIDNDKFALAYQPLVNTKTNEVESYEILIRMLDESSEIIMPFAFLPSAERYGFAVDIDKWVISKSISVLVDMRKSSPKMRFAINLSGQTFSDKSICNFIRKSIRDSGLEPGALTFEVTETMAIADMRAAVDILSELRSMGCKTALDDFGSGLSSFAYLKDLPVDIVKIDGQFVKNLATNLVDQAMVKAMNEVAQALNKQTVAEFVEDKESFELLAQFGVNYGQGYYLGKPEIIYPYSMNKKISHLKSKSE